ncbi:MAG: RNA polymerase sigma factor [Deltaproteobacteria bacterium]|nr:RNA polymerase sigma factor [Deltaproteobacteria bacterium]
MSEPSAMAEAAARHHESLYRFAMALCRYDRQEAMDVLQLTYVEVLEGRADLAHARDGKAFLLGVARRIAASRRRRRSLFGRIMSLGSFGEPKIAGPSPEALASACEDEARVRRALSALPARQLEVVTLVFMEGLTVEQAATALSVSVGSARTHYHRAKQSLAKMLEDHDAAR